jgi:hypothetical protein
MSGFRPIRPIAAATRLAGMLCLSLAGGCVRSEITPADPASTPSRVAIAVAETGVACPPGDWTIMRVAGNPEHPVTTTPGRTRSGDEAAYFAAGTARISAALPEGHPAPTAPGAIELKVHPPVRQAIVRGRRGESSAFWPLFQHISGRGIAMTGPVVMTGAMAGDAEGEASMSFLYRTAEQGPTGAAERGVTVEDTTTITVLSVGFQGSRSRERLLDLEARLQTWLDGQPAGDRWMRIGGPRLLGYNGPDTPWAKRWWELQVPVAWVATDGGAGTSDAGDASGG